MERDGNGLKPQLSEEDQPMFPIAFFLVAGLLTGLGIGLVVEAVLTFYLR